MMIVTETELLREGIEEVAKTVPTYSLVQEEKPEFIEDLENEEQEQEEKEDLEEEPKDETNNRM